MFKTTDTRLELALKVFQWNPDVADLQRVAKELDLTVYEFNKMTDEEFFKELYCYCNKRDSYSVS